MTVTLVRVRGTAVNLSAQDAEHLPRRMKILNWLENPNARGKRVFVGDKLIKAFSAPTYPFRTIPLDFEHNTLEGTPAYRESQEPRKIAAHCQVELVPGSGVFLSAPRWTPDGLENAANYCDLSAAPVLDDNGEVVAILSAALCRTGAVEGMDFVDVPVSLSADAMSAMADIINATEEKSVNWKEMICKALGLDPAATSDEDVGKALQNALKKPDAAAMNAAIATAVETAVKPLQETIAALNAAKSAGGKEGAVDLSKALKDGDATALNAAISAAVETALKPLHDQVAALNAGAESAKSELIKRDKQSALERARFAGKVISLNASAVAAMSLADLEDHISKTPVTVPLSARTPGVMDENAGQTITEDQKAIALNCGMDPQTVWPKKQ